MPSNSYELLPAGESTFEKIMHKGSSGTDNHFSAMMKKDHKAQKAAAADYFRHWDNKKASDETREIREERTAEYASLTRQYYNLATDLYEYGWSQSFHFCRFAYGEPFMQAIARHEHYLAHVTGIKKDMKVLDVGCGVGGPAREIAKFTGAYITGLNINEYQVQRATRYAQREGMADQLNFVQGDFMKMPFEDDTFDAVYAIEATVHAPSLAGVYSEIRRVLKPGGVFGVYEWVMTDAFDNDDVKQRQLRLDIEEGDGIANMVKAADALAAIKEAGLELLEYEDLADRPNDARPWYWPLDGSSWKYIQSIGDFMTTWRMSNVGRVVTHALISTLETLHIAPPGTARTSESLQTAARALVQGGRDKLFTPMFLMVARKPAAA